EKGRAGLAFARWRWGFRSDARQHGTHRRLAPRAEARGVRQDARRDSTGYACLHEGRHGRTADAGDVSVGKKTVATRCSKSRSDRKNKSSAIVLFADRFRSTFPKVVSASPLSLQGSSTAGDWSRLFPIRSGA